MERSDLENYEYQLSQVKQAYSVDPTNSELVTLKDELEDLIKLTKEYLKAAEAPETSEQPVASTSKPAKPKSAAPSQNSLYDQQAVKRKPAASGIKPGEECLAKWTDGKWHPAKLISVGGSAAAPVYSVIFKGYDTTELLGGNDLKAMTIDKKRQLEITAEDADKEKRRKKNVKKEETRAVKTAEQVGKQQAWQTFAKKGSKKGVVIPGLQGESMFQSPDNPFGRVGVVGSGKAMVSVADKKRHVFEATD